MSLGDGIKKGKRACRNAPSSTTKATRCQPCGGQNECGMVLQLRRVEVHSCVQHVGGSRRHCEGVSSPFPLCGASLQTSWGLEAATDNFAKYDGAAAERILLFASMSIPSFKIKFKL